MSEDKTWRRFIGKTHHTIATDESGQCRIECSQYGQKNYCRHTWMNHQFRRPGPECPLCNKANAQARICVETYEEAGHE